MVPWVVIGWVQLTHAQLWVGYGYSCQAQCRTLASVQLLAHSANHCLWTTVCNQEVSVNNFAYLSRLCALNNQQKKEVGPKIRTKIRLPTSLFMIGETKIRNSKMK
jgi:hypothetical protein